jgi:hypothetical protein
MIAERHRLAVRAFLDKELRVALGQRRLLLALVAGPFLLLVFFGIGFTGSRRQLQALLVVPERSSVPQSPLFYAQFFHWSMELTGVTTDGAAALTALDEGRVDVVVIPPNRPLDDLARDEPAVFQVVHKDLDPLEEAQLNALAFGHTRELNARVVEAVFENVLPAAEVNERAGGRRRR